MIKDHEVIPDGWQLTNFGDISIFEILGSGVKYYSGEKKYLSTSSIEGQNILYSEGDFTFFNRPSRANMQPVENSVWFAKMKNTLKVIAPDQETIDNTILSTGFSGIRAKNVHAGFLLQVLLSDHFNNQKNLLAEGSTQEAINNTKVRKINFLLPESFAEQQTIASILSKIDEAIAETEKLIAKYNRIKTGLMQDLLAKGIDEIGNIRSKETHEFKDSPLGRIPKEWEYCKMGKYIEENLYGPRFSANDYSENGNVKTIRGTDFSKSGEILYNQAPKAKLPQALIKNHQLHNNDVVIVTTADCGLTAVFKQPENDLPYIPSAYSVKFRFKKDVYPSYLKLFMTTSFASTQVYRFIRLGTLSNLPGSDLLDFDFLLPGLEEQLEIVKIVQSIDDFLNTEKAKLSKLHSLKTGLMQALLSGKVRVNAITPNQSAS